MTRIAAAPVARPAALLGVAAAVLLALSPAPAAAEERSVISLVPGWAEAGGGRVDGLTLRLAPGWKTYWRHPGDAGIAPEFDWSGSENLAAVEVLWPAPQAFDFFGMTTLGYADAVTLPLRVTAADPAHPVRLRLALFYGVCADICVPETAALTLDLAPGAVGDPAVDGAAIRAGLAALPATPAAAGVTVERCTLAGAGPERRFEGVFHLPRAAAAPTVAVVEGPPEAWFDAATIRLVGDRAHVAAALSPYGAPDWIDRGALRITLIGADGAVEVNGCAD